MCCAVGTGRAPAEIAERTLDECRIPTVDDERAPYECEVFLERLLGEPSESTP